MFVNLMGKSLNIKRSVLVRNGTKTGWRGKDKHTHTRADVICLGFMIRHVRLQIKSVISRLINDLANYQRYLKTL